MPPYIEMHREHLTLLLGYGGIGLFGIVLALTARRLAVSLKRKEEQERSERFPDGLEEKHRGVPLFLVLLYVALVVWAVIYVLAHGLWGMEFAG